MWIQSYTHHIEWALQRSYKYYNLQKKWRKKNIKHCTGSLGPGSGIFTRLLILFYITDLLYYDWVYRLLKPFELLFRNLGYTHSFRFKYFYGLFKGKKACNQSTESNLISVLLLTRILVSFFFFISSSNTSMKSKYDCMKNWITDGLWCMEICKTTYNLCFVFSITCFLT